MNSEHTKTALVLGALSGLRTLSATAVLSHYLRYNSNLKIRNRRLKFLNSAGFALLSKLLATGEIAIDKSPNVPDRVRPGGLSGRALSGALVGAAIYSINKRRAWKGALIGATSALAATFLSFYTRKQIIRNTRIPDQVIGTVEDVIAVGGSVAVLESDR